MSKQAKHRLKELSRSVATLLVRLEAKVQHRRGLTDTFDSASRRPSPLERGRR